MKKCDGVKYGGVSSCQASRSTHATTLVLEVSSYVDDLPIQRVQMLLDSDPASCQVGLFKTPERERKWAVSEAFLAPIPPGAFARRSDSARLAGFLEADGKLSLSKLLNSGQMSVGVRSGRSYGATADALLKGYDGKPNLLRLTTPDASKSLFQMVAAARVDVVLGYPYEAAYHLARDNPAANQGLQFHLLREQTVYVLVHVVCAKSPPGQEVIRKVDAVLNQPGRRDAMLGHYETWLDQSLRPLARRLQTQAITASLATGTSLRRSTLEAYFADVGHAADILVRSLHRAADLIVSFKQVSVDQTSSQRRRFDLAELVSEIVKTLWPNLKKTAFAVRQEMEPELLMDSFPGPLGQVLINLVNNAVMHGFEGRTSGTILIQARATEPSNVELCVRDDGIGIAPENLKRIYDPFFTTKLGAGGSGLGLNITHNIVESVLGGCIEAQSEVGVGAMFKINLPRLAPRATLADGIDADQALG